MKKTILLVLIAALLLSLTACSTKEERTKYDDAVKLYEEGKYQSALDLFNTIPDHKDSDEYIRHCSYFTALPIISPDSSVEDGFSGNVIDCTADNYARYLHAIELLKTADGYKSSDRALKAATKKLEKYNEESRTAQIIAQIENKFLGYLSSCEYDGVIFKLYFSDGYPITYDVLKRGHSETAVAESWDTVRGMFTEVIFEYLPDCTVEIYDCYRNKLGTYMRGETADQITILQDVATH